MINARIGRVTWQAPLRLPHEHEWNSARAPTPDAAPLATDRLVNTYSRECPAAIVCFTGDLDTLLAIHRVPVHHRI